MSATSAGEGLDERWPISPSSALDRLGDDGSHCLDVLAVHRPSGNSVTCSTRGNRSREIAGGTLRDRPSVVLTYIHNGQTPARGQVDVLVEVATVCGPVAEAAHAHTVRALVLEGQRCAGGGAQGGAQIPCHPRHDPQVERAVERDGAPFVVAGRLAQY